MQIERITVGKIIKPHGIAGECVVLSLSDTAKHWVKGNTFFLSSDLPQKSFRYETLQIESVRENKLKLIVKFYGISDRTTIENVCGAFLEVNSRTPIKQKWLFYIDDLINLTVYTSQKIKVGTITNVIELPPYHCIEIENEQGNTTLIPFLKKFVKDVNLENKTMVIKPIKGMIEWLDEK